MKRYVKLLCGTLALIAVIHMAVLFASALENSNVADKSALLSAALSDSQPTVASVAKSIPEETTQATVPAETAVAETASAQLPAEEMVPAVTAPVPMLPVERLPVETRPAETLPVETIPEVTYELKEYAQVPLYFQTDYPDDLYGNGTIESSGCSITSLAMVATYLTGYEYLPDQLARYFGPYIGNNMERLEYASDMLQLPWKKAENWHKSLAVLKEGNVVIALMGKNSRFTDSQHFIVITGVTEDGKILVNDPYEPNYEKWDLKNGFAEGFPQGYISQGMSGSWIYYKDQMPEDPFIYVEEEVSHDEPRYPDMELTQDDINLLARMIWVEARGETIEGQQAIAEVVLNRVAADNFADSVRSVIYSEGQFKSVDFLDDAEPTQTQYAAIEKAIYGPYILPEDVVFFATYPVNKNVWGDIGGHTFCYQW